jgi:hypothetical protein
MSSLNSSKPSSGGSEPGNSLPQTGNLRTHKAPKTEAMIGFVQKASQQNNMGQVTQVLLFLSPQIAIWLITSLLAAGRRVKTFLFS